MKHEKSLRQLAKELEVSPAYLSMILSGQRKCPEKLQGALCLFTNVHKTKLNGAWKAGTLPTELLPQNRIYSSPKMPLCQKGELRRNLITEGAMVASKKCYPRL